MEVISIVNWTHDVHSGNRFQFVLFCNIACTINISQRHQRYSSHKHTMNCFSIVPSGPLGENICNMKTIHSISGQSMCFLMCFGSNAFSCVCVAMFVRSCCFHVGLHESLSLRCCRCVNGCVSIQIVCYEDIFKSNTRC